MEMYKSKSIKIRKMKIILFGSTGMLGKYVEQYFIKERYEVICVVRSIFDIESEDWKKLNDWLNENVTHGEDILINCAGAIPQQNCCPRKFIVLNTIFPQNIQCWLKQSQCQFIHITTDCVFSGEYGNYNENNRHDSTELYGITKSMGEKICEGVKMCIIRTSIIGEEGKNKNSLLEWVLKNKDKKIDGYENVLWNGVCCLQLAKIIEHIVRTKQLWRGTRHFFSPQPVSKYRLCKIINDVYELNITIQKKITPHKNMTLSTLYDFPEGVTIPTIEEQIKEQKQFSLEYLHFHKQQT